MRFYVWEAGVDSLPPEANLHGLSLEIWRPRGLHMRPTGLPRMPYATWWAFHHLRVFSNRECGIVLLRENNRIVHTSLVTPRYFRFADMGESDIQIGATFTEASWRGRGLAKAAIRIVCDAWAGRFSKLWYIVGDDNPASIRVIEKCQFRLVGTGERVRRCGFELLGQYRILKPADTQVE